MWPGTEPPVAEVPEGLVDTVARFPLDGSVLAAASYHSDGYFFIGGEEPIAKIDNNRRRDSYRLQKLIRKSERSGISEELPIKRDGGDARVTVILPHRDKVWLGTHQGVAKYDARRNEWSWLGTAELHMSNVAWDAVVQKDEMETLWQKGSLTQAVARIEAESYPPSDAGLLYRDEPQLEEAGKQMRTFLEAGRLVSAASHSMNLLELRLQALRRAGPSGAAALFRAEGELYQGLYRAGENALTVMVQRNNKHHPILQAEAARLLWESRAFAHGDADAASLKLAREQYRLAARGRGPEAMWACYGLMRLAVACNEDVRQAAAEVTRRFPRSVVAEEARRFLSAMNTSDPPVLCTHMASPQDTLAVRVFPRRGFVMGSFGDQCYNFTQAAWVDGMGVFINEDRIEGRQWHSRSLVWPGYSFRPGVCVVDYYADRQFVLRRTFIVQGEVPNEAN